MFSKVSKLSKTNLIVLFSYQALVFNLFYVFGHFWHAIVQNQYLCLSRGTSTVNLCFEEIGQRNITAKNWLSV